MRECVSPSSSGAHTTVKGPRSFCQWPAAPPHESYSSSNPRRCSPPVCSREGSCVPSSVVYICLPVPPSYNQPRALFSPSYTVPRRRAFLARASPYRLCLFLCVSSPPIPFCRFEALVLSAPVSSLSIERAQAAPVWPGAYFTLPCAAPLREETSEPLQSEGLCRPLRGYVVRHAVFTNTPRDQSPAREAQRHHIPSHTPNVTEHTPPRGPLAPCCSWVRDTACQTPHVCLCAVPCARVTREQRL